MGYAVGTGVYVDKNDDANIEQSLAIRNQVAPADGHGG